jgi:hypothetical protein
LRCHSFFSFPPFRWLHDLQDLMQARNRPTGINDLHRYDEHDGHNPHRDERQQRGFHICPIQFDLLFSGDHNAALD